MCTSSSHPPRDHHVHTEHTLIPNASVSQLLAFACIHLDLGSEDLFSYRLHLPSGRSRETYPQGLHTTSSPLTLQCKPNHKSRIPRSLKKHNKQYKPHARGLAHVDEVKSPAITKFHLQPFTLYSTPKPSGRGQQRTQPHGER